MALHWAHIKGFCGETSERLLDTYIHFKGGPTSGDYRDNIEDYLPNISITAHGGNPDYYDCGHIVTNGVLNHIHFPIIFDNNSGIVLRNGSGVVFDDRSNVLGTTGSNCYFYRDTNGFHGYSLTAVELLIADDVEGDPGYLNIGTTGTSVYTHIYGSLWTGSQFSTDSNIIAAGYAQALYFNATSDIRAKENLQPVPTNMLDLVKQLQVYTFNYKNKSQEKSIGIIAQDVQDFNINGFSLIENPNASGENGDYMSIRESKLVYILLEAVKELSAKVEELEREIHGNK